MARSGIESSQAVVVACVPDTMDINAELAELERRLPAWTRELLDCLTPRQREAFVIREALGLPFDQVSERMDVSHERGSQLHQAAMKTITDAARRAALLTRHVPLVVLHVQPGSDARCRVPDEMRGALELPIASLALGVRAAKCMDRSGILVVGDLVPKSEGELLKIRNVGRKTLKEIKKALGAIGLHLGMDCDPTLPAASAGTQPM